MCEVSGNRGILILIRQLPTGPSNRPPARDASAGAGWPRGAVVLRQTRRAARGVENLI